MRELVEYRHERSMYRQAAGSLTELSYPKIRSVKSCGFLLTYIPTEICTASSCH
jgi:hypothetical protein